MNGESKVEERIRAAGTAVTLGLLVEIGTLFSTSPAAFLIFALAGGTLIAGGALWFLLGLVRS